MFIRCVKKQRSQNSKIFFQYTLAQTSRVDKKIKQRSILYLGSDKLLEDKTNRAIVLQILKSKIFDQPDLFPLQCPKELKALAAHYYKKYLLKYQQEGKPAPTSIPPAPKLAEYHNIDLKSFELGDVRSFGAENLCKQIMNKLGLPKFFKQLGFNDKQNKIALISLAARAIFSSTEHKTAQILEINSELAQCFQYTDKITYKRLYTAADKLYKYKDEIDKYLCGKVTDIFDLKDKHVIFDISNTYFETGKKQSKLARYGRSKEKRNDCPIVVFTGVINAEGFIRHSRIYQGNTSDSATLEDMLKDMEKHSAPGIERTVVIDAGIATEDNLELLNAKHYKYVCVSRNRLKDYPVENLRQIVNEHNKEKVKLSIFHPEEHSDTWMYVQSQAKRKKEEAMDEKLTQRFEEDLQTIKTAIGKKGGVKKIEKIWERIGRMKQKHLRLSGQYEINVEQQNGIGVAMSWKRKPSKITEDKTKGVYFIRTNYTEVNEEKLWDIYNTIREVESTFRCLKSDLKIRPVHHQNDSRIESHIYLTMLAYQIVNTVRYMLKQNGIRYDWQNIVRILSTHTIQTAVFPSDKKEITMRMPSKPLAEVEQIYQATGCKQTRTPTKKQVLYH